MLSSLDTLNSAKLMHHWLPTHNLTRKPDHIGQLTASKDRLVIRFGTVDVGYQRQVSQFIQAQDRHLRPQRRLVQEKAWALATHQSPQAEDESVQAIRHYQSALADFDAYTRVNVLITSPGFETLDLASRRALQVLKTFFSLESDHNEYPALGEIITRQRFNLLRLLQSTPKTLLVADTPPPGQRKTLPQLMLENVATRNEQAVRCGFNNYYDMILSGQHLDPAMVDATLEQMQGQLQRYCEILRGIDLRFDELEKAGKLYGFDPQALLNSGLPKNSPFEILDQTAKKMGISLKYLEELFTQTEVSARPGKAQKAFSLSVDPPFDVRTLLNLPKQPYQISESDMKKQLLHELFGHGVDAKCIDPKLPAILRDHESFSKEAFAMLMESLYHDPKWLIEVLGVEPEALNLAQPLLHFNELAQKISDLMSGIGLIKFERAMYQNPDQDMDKLASRVMSEVSGRPIQYPPGHWPLMSKLLIYKPATYHTYFLGDLWAAQVREHLEKNFGGLLNPQAGQFLMGHRSQGLLYPWPEELERMTGKPLSSDAILKRLDGLVDSVQRQLDQLSAS